MGGRTTVQNSKTTYTKSKYFILSFYRNYGNTWIEIGVIKRKRSVLTREL